MVLIKVGPKYQVTIPKVAREVIGLNAGDFLEPIVSNEGLLLRPKLVVDRQLDINQRLEAAEAAIKAGRVLGPFTTAPAAMRAINKYARARHHK